MQLKKQSIRKAPNFHELDCPRGMHRNPADFNQRKNMAQANRNKRGDSFPA